jgi:hypothetical protein
MWFDPSIGTALREKPLFRCIKGLLPIDDSDPKERFFRLDVRFTGTAATMYEN